MKTNTLKKMRPFKFYFSGYLKKTILATSLILFESAIILGQTYQLVTSTDQLEIGKRYLIIGQDKGIYYALGKQNANNRSGVAVQIADDATTVTIAAIPEDTDHPFAITLRGAKDAWELHDDVNHTVLGPAASSSSDNCLKPNNSGKAPLFTINVDSDQGAEIICFGEQANTHQNARNTLKFNDINKLFACYASGQKDIYLYKERSSSSDILQRLDFGEIELGKTKVDSLAVNLSDLDSQKTGYYLFNNGNSAFSVQQSSNWDPNAGGFLNISFTPFSEGDVVDTLYITVENNVVVKRIVLKGFAYKLYTITLDPVAGKLSEESTLKQTSKGSSIDLPTPTLINSDCTDQNWTFAGWSKVKEEAKTSALSNALFASGEFTPTEDLTLFAVYCKYTQGEPVFEPNFVEHIFVIAGKKNNAYYALPNDASGKYGTGQEITSLVNSNGTIDSSFAASYIHTLQKNQNNEMTIRQGAAEKGNYVKYGASSSDMAFLPALDDKAYWRLSAGEYGTYRLTSAADISRLLLFRWNEGQSYHLRFAAYTNASETEFLDLELLPVIAAVYHSAPSCSSAMPEITVHPKVLNFGKIKVEEQKNMELSVCANFLKDDISLRIEGEHAHKFSLNKNTVINPPSGNITDSLVIITYIPNEDIAEHRAKLILYASEASDTVLLSGECVNESSSPNVIITAVYGGGGNKDASYTNDYIELHNTTNASVDLHGHYLSYLSQSQTTAANNNTISLSGRIPAKGFFLISGTGGENGRDLPQTDFSTTLALGAESGKVVLATDRDLTLIKDYHDIASIVDVVAYGSNSAPDGISVTQTKDLNSRMAAVRKFGDHQFAYHRNSVSGDFEHVVPTGVFAPRNSETAVLPDIQTDHKNINFGKILIGDTSGWKNITAAKLFFSSGISWKLTENEKNAFLVDSQNFSEEGRLSLRFSPTDTVEYLATLTFFANGVPDKNILLKGKGINQKFFEDFEASEPDLASKSSCEGALFDLKTGRWYIAGVGTMLENDRYNDNQSIRLRGNHQDTNELQHRIQMDFDKPNGIGTISFAYGSYGANKNGGLIVQYSSNQGMTWENYGDTIQAAKWTGDMLSASVTINQPGYGRIRILKISSPESILNIDDIEITDYEEDAEPPFIILTGDGNFGAVPLNEEAESEFEVEADNLTESLFYSITGKDSGVFFVHENDWNSVAGGMLIVKFCPRHVRHYQATLEIYSIGVDPQRIPLAGEGISENAVFDPQNQIPIVLFPNPANDELHIQADPPAAKIEIYQLNGQIVLQSQYYTQKINISNLAKGAYVVRITLSDGTVFSKIIVK